MIFKAVIIQANVNYTNVAISPNELGQEEDETAHHQKSFHCGDSLLTLFRQNAISIYWRIWLDTGEADLGPADSIGR